VAAVAVAGKRVLDSKAASSDARATATVRRGALRITVSEGGHVEAQRSISVKCQVPGRPTIIKIVEEGSNVEEGDVLVELDSAELEERLTGQQITTENAEASYAQAKEQFEIQKSENESRLKAAELKVKFAKTDLEKFLEGDKPQKIRKATTDIIIAREELERAKEQFEATKRLRDRDYVTETQLRKDELALKRAELLLEEYVAALDLLERYTLERQRIQLESDYEEAVKDKERKIRQANAQLSKSEADLKGKEKTLKLQRGRLAKLTKQLGKCVIKAPQSGLVVYAGSGSRYRTTRIEEGAQVYERQTIIQLPDVTAMKVNTKVHESVVDKVEEGQRATVRVDAFSDMVLEGRVSSVAVLPDSQSRWMNPDLKVYTTEVEILDQKKVELKPGMSARVEILIASLKDVVYVPIQSVTVRRGKQVCFVMKDGDSEEVVVETGMNNDKFVEIKKGLKERQEILLYAPVVPEKEEGDEEVDQPEEPTAKAAKSPAKPKRAPAAKGKSGHGGRAMTAEQKEMMRKYRTASPEERKKLQAQWQRKQGARGRSSGSKRPAQTPQRSQ